MKRKSKYKVLVCVIILICIGATLISKSDISAEAEVTTKPSFDIEMNPIKIISNDLPNIEATLLGDETRLSSINQDVAITYKITPESFKFQDNGTQIVPKEVVFVVDNSESMIYLNELKHLWSGLLNDYNKGGAKFGLVTYNESATINSELTTDKAIKDELDSIKVSKSDKRNIGDAIAKSDEILLKGQQDTDKFMILISTDDIIYNKDQVNSVKNKDYNFISLKIGKSEDENNANSLKHLHNVLGRSLDDYFNQVINNDGDANDVVKQMAERLYVNRYNPYIFSDAKLNFNIGNEFEVVSGITPVTNNPLNNYVLGLPEIKYVYDNESKEYVYNNGVDESKSFEVSFVIKPIKYGEHKFKAKNEISYKNLVEKPINKGIKTPTIKVEAQADITHGLYNGIDTTTKSVIIDKEERTLAKESNVTFAASFETYNSKASIGLKVHDEIRVVDNPKVYKVVEDGSLKLLGEMTKEPLDLGYSYTLGEGVKDKDNIVVLYNCKLPSELGGYKNEVTVDGTIAPALIRVGEDKLPDLF